jgi:hypothetical protein
MRLLGLCLGIGCGSTTHRGDATCEHVDCADDWAGELLHEGYDRCIECDAETDTCEASYYGDDGQLIEHCPDGPITCDYSVPPIYCTGGK